MHSSRRWSQRHPPTSAPTALTPDRPALPVPSSPVLPSSPPMSSSSTVVNASAPTALSDASPTFIAFTSPPPHMHPGASSPPARALPTHAAGTSSSRTSTETLSVAATSSVVNCARRVRIASTTTVTSGVFILMLPLSTPGASSLSAVRTVVPHLALEAATACAFAPIARTSHSSSVDTSTLASPKKA